MPMSSGSSTSFLDLDDFTQGYVTCMLWAESDDEGVPLDKNYDFDDFTPELRATVLNDCARFQHDNADDIKDRKSLAGHDFWLTRNGHGSGFWDGDWPEAGDRLTEASKAYGEFDLYVGDDGVIYGYPPP